MSAPDDIDALIANTPAAADADLDKLIAETPAAPKKALSKPQARVGGFEHFVNKAADAYPFMRPVANTLAAGIVHFARPTNNVKLGPAALDAGAVQPAPPPDPSLLEDYRNVRDSVQRQEALRREQNPGFDAADLGGTAVGFGLGLATPFMPKVVAGEGRVGGLVAKGLGTGRVGRAAANLLTLGGYGTANTLASGRADLSRGQFGQAMTDLSGTEGFSQAAKDWEQGNKLAAVADVAGAGVPGAVATGLGLQAAAKPLGYLSKTVGGKLATGLAKRSADAEELRAAGVKGLTVGQQVEPESKLGQMEDAAQSAFLFGKTLENQRNAARASWEDTALSKGAAPPDPAAPAPDLSGNINEKLSQVHDTYGPAYDAVGANPVKPAGPQGHPLNVIIPAAADNPDILADDATRGAVRSWLKNQLTLLPDSRDMKAADLIKLRSNLRKQIRSSERGNNSTAADLLRVAEDRLSASLEGQLPTDAAQKLQATDAQYRNYKTLENAVARSKDNVSELTPSKLSEAVASTTPSKSAYARGAGGELRKLAKAGKAVLDNKVARSGEKAQRFPLHTDIPAAFLFNRVNESPALQNFIFGDTAWQRALQSVPQAVSAKLPHSGRNASAILADILAGRPQGGGAQMPAWAGDEATLNQLAQAEALRKRRTGSFDLENP